MLPILNQCYLHSSETWICRRHTLWCWLHCIC